MKSIAGTWIYELLSDSFCTMSGGGDGTDCILRTSLTKKALDNSLDFEDLELA